MVEDRIDPSEQIPEADLLEQQASLDPPPLTHEEAASLNPDAPADPVDEADRVEQQAAVLDDHEDDYPHQPS